MNGWKTVDLGTRLDFETLPELIKNLDFGYNKLHIKTRDLQWVEPCCMAPLVCYIRDMVGAGKEVTIDGCVNNEDVERYFRRIDFYKILGIDKKEDFNRHPSYGRFVEIQALGCRDAARVDQVADFISKLFLVDEQLRKYMSYMVRETIQNAIDHSCSYSGVTIMGQYWAPLDKAQVCVADCGVGFRSSLGRSYNVASEPEAILKALEPGVTGKVPGPYSTSFNNVGYGLYFVKEMVSRNAGLLCIISNDGLYSLANGNTICEHVKSAWKGSMVIIELNRGTLAEQFDCLLEELRRDAFGSSEEVGKRLRFV